MPLSWNEIRHRAIAFSKEWKGAVREASERQTFWNEFFNVFGVRCRTVATFEEPVKKLSGDWGFIDLFWPGKLLVEHKSAGADLGKAHAQGLAYIRGLKDSKRDREIPRWLIVAEGGPVMMAQVTGLVVTAGDAEGTAHWRCDPQKSATYLLELSADVTP